MADIARITLPSGSTYDIKDAYARQQIEALSGFTYFIGVTTTPLTDGSTTNPITVNGDSITAETGAICTYQSAEFVWNGSAWQEFGDLSALGNLAYADTASSTYTPAGTVSLTNSNTTADVSSADSGTATYTPAGTITAGAITVKTAGDTDTIHNPTKETVMKSIDTAAPSATAPTNSITYYAVANETLSLYQIGYTTGDSITTSDVTVKTSDAAYESADPTFSGTAVRLVTGNISVPSSASFSGTQATIQVTPDAQS